MSAARRQPARDRARDAGTSTVELVITMPALLLLVLAVIQFGLWAHAQHIALAAAQDGVTAARAYGATDQAGRDRANHSVDRFGPSVLRRPAVAVGRTPQEVTVTVTGHATSILGLFSFPVREQARGPVERFVAATGGVR